MSKTKNSRKEISNYLDKIIDEQSPVNIKNYLEIRDNISNKFSRHPNRKRSRHTLVKEWMGIRWLGGFYKIDGRMGDCYDRSDRTAGARHSVNGVRRAKQKQNLIKELKNI